MGFKQIKIPNSYEEWLENRLRGIGGSDAGAILGVNEYSSPYKLWAYKTGRIDSADDNEAMRQGRDLEQYVADRFMEETGKKVEPSDYSYQSIEHPFMLANIDRWVVGENAGLECKTANVFKNKTYEKGEIPPSYYAQCQHYMAVTDAETWYIAVLVFGTAFYYWEVPRNEEYINTMIEMEEEFWNMVENDEAPSIDGSIATKQALDEIYNNPEDTVADLSMINIFLDNLQSVNRQIKELTDRKAVYENTIKEFMGDSIYGKNYKYLTTWKPQTRKTFDSKRFKKEHKDLYEKYLKESTSRRLTIKEIEYGDD